MFKFLGIVSLSLFFWGCSSHPQTNFIIEELEYPANLQVIKRADWGWKTLTDTIKQHRIERITLHHGGVEFTEGKDVQDYIRTMQDWSRSKKKWIDIPYHWMIDLDGKIYETRPINYPGDTNTDYDVRGHALINVIGNYEVQKLKPVQLNAVIQLSAFLAQKYQIDPVDIRGHKDYTETLCPGKDFYRYLQDSTIQNRVKELLNSMSAN